MRVFTPGWCVPTLPFWFLFFHNINSIVYSNSFKNNLYQSLIKFNNNHLKQHSNLNSTYSQDLYLVEMHM